jgi:hypothetical protein
MELDEIFYAALTSDESLVALTNGNIVTCCFETPPDADDNTPLPYVIIMEEPSQNEEGTKDTVWESEYDNESVCIEIAAATKKEFKRLRRKVRHVLATYIENMDYSQKPELTNRPSKEGMTWDWLRPCYYDRLHYQCDVLTTNDEDDEQED